MLVQQKLHMLLFFSVTPFWNELNCFWLYKMLPAEHQLNEFVISPTPSFYRGILGRFVLVARPNLYKLIVNC